MKSAKDRLTLTSFSWEGTVPNANAKGETVFTIKAKSSKNVEGSASVTFGRYARTAVIEYNGQAMGGTVDSFDATKVKAYKDAVRYEAVDFELTYTRNGKTVSADDLNAPGNYTATATVKDSTYNYGGSATVSWTVNASKVDVDDIYITFDGDLIDDNVSTIYSAADVMDKVAFKAYYKGEEVPASEFDLVVTKDGEKVDEIVDAGDYTIAVKTKPGSIYQVDGIDNDVVLTVVPVKLSGNVGDNAEIRLAGAPELVGQKDTYAWTGEAVIPTFEYDLTGDDSRNWIALPESSYKISYEIYDEDLAKWVEVDSAVDPGLYKATLTDNAKDGNYVVKASQKFYVSDKNVYLDVPNNEWYSEVVYTATKLEYMTGYSGQSLFGPNDSITRGQVACVLYNMAGGDKTHANHEFGYTEDRGYETGFSDVDGHQYYAKAIAWAKANGVVNGYGDGTFAPDASITREEFAAMLSNYAAKMGDDVDGAEADLSAFDDASQVSDWATEAIEWAVANEVMGNGGFLAPTANITRAEAAAMAVNYQPEIPDTIF